jgi:hypothetical protein
MRGTLTEDARIALIKKLGSAAKATKDLKSMMSWSHSKSDKIMHGRYPSLITELEGRTLAKFLKWPIERTFRLSEKQRDAS